MVLNRYYSNVLYNEWLNKHQHNITQDNEVLVAELGKGEVVYNVGITTVKRLPSPSVYSNEVDSNETLPLSYSVSQGINDSESEAGNLLPLLAWCNHNLPHSIIRGEII